MMIATLNPVTIGLDKTFDDLLTSAAEAKFTALECSIEPLTEIADKKGNEAASDLLLSYKLELGSFFLPVEFRKDEATFRAGLAELPKHAALAQFLGNKICTTWLYPATDESPAEFTCKIISRLRQCAKILGQYGIRFGVEWVGPKTLRTMKYEFIHNIPGALDLIAAIDEPNVGLLFDSFHWYTSHATVDDILALSADQIVMVHINDAPDKLKDEQIDDQRLLPGEGVIPLAAMLQALRTIGYNSWAAVETFSDKLAKLPPNKSAKLAKAAADRVLNQG